MNLPAVAPDVVADAVESLPARLRSRLDNAIEQAKTWPVTTIPGGCEITTEEQIKIILRVPVNAPEKAVCSCLLAPRCLHRTAVLCCAPTLDAAPEAAPTPVPADQPGQPVTKAEKAAAQALWNATIPLLEKGIGGADAIMQADLLRAVHDAKQSGLHRPASTAIAVVQRIRAARAQDKSFRLAELADDVRELLLCCHQLTSGGNTGSARGVARRDYESVGDLKLYGLFCEPLQTASGYVGAVTYLADEQSRIWQVSDARPGDARQASRATGASVDIGDIRISHRELSRAGLLAAQALASADGRLSHGRKVQAVQTGGLTWYQKPVLGLWQTSLSQQLTRWLDGLDLSLVDRPGGYDLAFLDGVVTGADRHGLLLAGDGVAGLVNVAAPLEDPGLPYVSNLRQLAEHATGRRIRLAGRFAGPLLVHGLAFSADWLPARFGSHVALGSDRLQKADLPGATAQPAGAAPAPPSSPLSFLRHTIERVLSAGRSALLGGVGADAHRLARSHLYTAAALLTALGNTGGRRSRDVFGRLDPLDSHQLAQAWLAAAIYERAAASSATRRAWEGDHRTVSG